MFPKSTLVHLTHSGLKFGFQNLLQETPSFTFAETEQKASKEGTKNNNDQASKDYKRKIGVYS